MKNMKNSITEKAAKACMKIGATAAESLSVFVIWYEPKINSKLINKKTR